VPEAASASNSGVGMSLDRTHLNPYGQKVFGRMVADAIVKTQVELGPDLIGVPGGPTTVQPGGPPGVVFDIICRRYFGAICRRLLASQLGRAIDGDAPGILQAPICHGINDRAG
jgi:hypothetical protein